MINLSKQQQGYSQRYYVVLFVRRHICSVFDEYQRFWKVLYYKIYGTTIKWSLLKKLFKNIIIMSRKKK